MCTKCYAAYLRTDKLQILQNVSLINLRLHFWFKACFNEQKTQVLKEFKIFLGLSVYASRWIKNLVAISEPLWKLTRSDVRWEWTEELQRLFDLIKQSLINAFGYFDLNWHTFVIFDASPVGLRYWHNSIQKTKIKRN